MKQKKTFFRVLRRIRPYSFFVILSILCGAVSVAAQLLVPIFCGDAIDYMLGIGRVDFEAVEKLIFSIALVTALSAAAQWVLAACNNRVTFCVSRDLRNEAMKKIQNLPLSYLDAHPSGDLVSRIIADVDTFADGLLMGFTQFFTGILTIFGTLGIMLFLNPGITAIVVLLTPLSLFVAGFIAKRTYKYFGKQAKVRGEQTALINEMVEGQKVVQAFGYEEKSMEAFDEVNERLRDVSVKAVFFSSLTNPSTRLVNNIVYAGVGLASAMIAISGGITIGELSIFLSYASQYAKPFNEISGVVTEMQNALACAARILELVDVPDEMPDKENAAEFQSQGQVSLSHVSFSYDPDKPLIEDLNLEVKPGQRIAIVGPTGCGKTTLINLLMRFYDVRQGSIKIDGTDIRDMTRHSLRQNFGMVLQDTWLKAGTIRENIAYGKPDATEEEIKKAAKLANADEFIKKLPEGYQTMVGERGIKLSGGQRQRIAIARAILKDAPILVLDEATSALDSESEALIQEALNNLMKGRTSIVVAHRLSTIAGLDEIVVLDDGKIVEQGNHHALLNKNGEYARLWSRQSGAFLDAD